MILLGECGIADGLPAFGRGTAGSVRQTLAHVTRTCATGDVKIVSVVSVVVGQDKLPLVLVTQRVWWLILGPIHVLRSRLPNSLHPGSLVLTTK